jgi:hypothetical protein
MLQVGGHLRGPIFGFRLVTAVGSDRRAPHPKRWRKYWSLLKVLSISARPRTAQEAEARLQALSADHPFKSYLLGRLRTKVSAPKAVAGQAREFVLQVMAADVGTEHASSPYLKKDCHALIRCAYWTAEADPGRLIPTVFFDETHLQWFALLGGLRSSDRSRDALVASLRRFRGAYSKLFPPARPATVGSAGLEAITDEELAYALERAETFRSESTTRFVQAWLLLGRSAGLDGADMRYVAGTDVTARRHAGVWVAVRHPGHEREVPVLAEWADQLRQLAQIAGPDSMLISGPSPASVGRSNELTSMLARHLDSTHPGLKVTADRLRTAWLADQLRRDVPLRSLLRVAGLRSLRSIERLVSELPAPASSHQELAYQLGGVEERGRGQLTVLAGGQR